MKYLTAVLALALAATALAAPTTGTTCTFGTYRCTTPNTGIEICDIAGQWELVGPCPNGTSCHDLPQNGFTLPFCTNNAQKLRARNDQPGDKCTTPGRYQCLGTGAIQVCDTQNVLEFVGNCPAGSHCDYIGVIPYCVL